MTDFNKVMLQPGVGKFDPLITEFQGVGVSEGDGRYRPVGIVFPPKPFGIDAGVFAAAGFFLAAWI